MHKFLSRRTILISVVLVFYLPQISISSTPSSERNNRIIALFDSTVSAFMENSNAPGVAIGIVIDGEAILQKGYGARKLGEPELIDQHTVFRIASISKGFASALTGILVEEGTLNWEDKIIKYLPEFELKDTTTTQSLTIRHILSHTSGLMPYAYDNLLEANVPFERILGKLKEISSICSLGKCYSYQNVLYSLIGEVIESATGKEYQEVLNQMILSPLGMKNVSMTKNGLISSNNFAAPHRRRYGKYIPATVKNTYYSVSPAAGINASIEDMVKWMQAMLGNNPSVLSKNVINGITKPIVKTTKEIRRFNWHNRIRSAHYGMGWRIFDYSGQTLVFHSGGISGYHCQFAFLPAHNTGIIVLKNSWFVNHFLYTFLDLYLDIQTNRKPTLKPKLVQ